MFTLQLEKLLEAHWCTQTVKTKLEAQAKDSFVAEEVEAAYAKLKKWEKSGVASGPKRDRTLFRKKLGFVASLKKSGQVGVKVKDYLQDSKRRRVFHESQGDLYGELLVAKAKDEIKDTDRHLKALRRKSNKEGSKEQEPWVFPTSEPIVYDPKTEADARTLLDVKLEKILERAKGSATEIADEALDILGELLDEDDELEEALSDSFSSDEYVGPERELVGGTARVMADDGPEGPEEVRGEELPTYPFTEEQFAGGRRIETLLRSFIVLEKRGVDLGISTLESLGIKLDVLTRELYEQDQGESRVEEIRNLLEEVRGTIEEYKEKDVDKTIKVIERKIKRGEDWFRSDKPTKEEEKMMGIIQGEELETELLREEFTHIGTKLSDKLKGKKEIRYSMELSDKDPLDVTFGNKSGCCLRVREKGNIQGAYSLPEIMVDNATYVFKIYQHIEGRTKKEVGIVLAFDGREGAQAIFVGNSTELSGSMTPVSIAENVVEYVEQGLIAYGKEKGFDLGTMGAHDFNTSENYSSRRRNIRKGKGINKVMRKGSRGVYSNVFDDFGEGEGDCYILFDRRDAA